MTYFGSRLKYLRKQEDITQEQLAKSLGVAKSTISMYENGRREPDFEAIEAISDFFNVNMRTFFPDGKVEESTLISGDELNKSEQYLLSLFRKIPTKDKEMVIQMVEAALKSRKLL